jgi:hypothetical protein
VLPRRRERRIVEPTGLKEGEMHANVGDRLLVEGRTAEAARREGEVLEVRGKDGTPPFLVRWSDGHEGLVFPGPDAHVLPGGGPAGQN